MHRKTNLSSFFSKLKKKSFGGALLSTGDLSCQTRDQTTAPMLEAPGKFQKTDLREFLQVSTSLWPLFRSNQSISNSTEDFLVFIPRQDIEESME